LTAPVGKEGKYARPERERRFLLAAVPDDVEPLSVSMITDRYIEKTRLRLRRMVTTSPEGEELLYKFGQKVPGSNGRRALITNLYLSAAEYGTLGQLPGRVLTKRRYRIPPFSVDVFEGALAGLILAEIEFDSDQAMSAFAPPRWSLAEVTADQRFTGGRLVSASADELRSWLAEYPRDARA
jgi:CYTH domain-containing protein